MPFWWIIHYFFRIYGVILATAVGGLTGAYVFAITSEIFYRILGGTADQTDSITWWQYFGWILVGGVFLSMRIYQIRNERVSLPRKAGHLLVNLKEKHVEREDEVPVERNEKIHAKQDDDFIQYCTIAFLGGFLGFLMGVSLLLIWYSLTWSPFYPTSDPDTTSINLTVALYLLGISAVFGAVVYVVSNVIEEMDMKKRLKSHQEEHENL